MRSSPNTEQRTPPCANEYGKANTPVPTQILQRFATVSSKDVVPEARTMQAEGGVWWNLKLWWPRSMQADHEDSW
eukprot:CAMPEP_0182465240 /NCGR_PEP_ID=MMETSP1319-20130603/9087_1 /TAXON_ID=172717 /ORGANISM="Bolidomonas pacifica, Strain RCC208" /LENGTH=74 /DNA_ID=CAMNT_0024664933 /DNA_START=15 /DNA_END=240 /DNA_ORIENTATION=+